MTCRRIQQVQVEIGAPFGGKCITADQMGQKRDDVGGSRVAGSLMQHHAADQVATKLVPVTIVAGQALDQGGNILRLPVGVLQRRPGNLPKPPRSTPLPAEGRMPK